MKINPNILPDDTTNDIAARQFEVLKGMDINTRAEMTFQLGDNLRSIVEAGILQRHPDYNLVQIKQAVLSLILDKNLLSQAFGGQEVSA